MRLLNHIRWLALVLLIGVAEAATYTIPVPNVYNQVGAWVDVSGSADARTFILSATQHDGVLIEFETQGTGYVSVARLNGPSSERDVAFAASRIRARRVRGSDAVTLVMKAEDNLGGAPITQVFGLASSVYQVPSAALDVVAITRNLTIAYNGCDTCTVSVEGSIGGVWASIGRLTGDSYFRTEKSGFELIRTKRLAGVYDPAERVTVFGVSGDINKHVAGWINVKSYGAKGDGIADDTPAIQSALTASSSGARVLFPPGSYLVSPLTFSGNNVTLEGVPGASVLIAKTGAGTTVLTNDIETVYSGLSPASDIASNAVTVAFAEGSIANVLAGDFCRIATTKADPYNAAYKLGTLRRVVATTATSVVLDGPVTTSYALATDGVSASFYRPQRNVTIRGLSFRLAANQQQKAASLRYVDGLTVEDSRFDGVSGDSFHGLSAMGLAIRVSRIRASHFLDAALVYGYGVVVSGHDIVIRDSFIENCKHGLASGDNSFRNSGITYERNTARAAMLDFHGSVEDSEASGNVIAEIGATAYQVSGIQLRGPRQRVVANTFIESASAVVATRAISVLDVGRHGIVVARNRIIGTDEAVNATVTAGASNWRIEDNEIVTTNSAISLNDVSRVIIARNQIDTGSTAIYLKASDAVTITGNVGTYGKTISSTGGVYLDPGTRVGSGVVISGNQFKAGASTATNPVRIRAGWNNVVIHSNVLDASVVAGASGVRLDEGTDLSVYSQFGNVMNSTYATGERLFKKAPHSSPVAWSPNIANGSTGSASVTVSGASQGDIVTAGFSRALPAGASMVAQVTADNTVTVSVTNNSGAVWAPGSGQLIVDVWKH